MSRRSQQRRKQNQLLYGIILITLLAVFGWVMWPVVFSNQDKQEPAAPTAQLAISEAELLEQWHQDIQPMLEHHCYDCHGDGSSKGKLDLEEYPDLASMRKNPKLWAHIIARVEYHLMPPPKEEQPTPQERQQIAKWINQAVFPVDPNQPPIGKPVIRRMNRSEYQNTIRDLLGVKIVAAQLLPPDDSGHGFDNIGSVLTISPSHIEKYLTAAEKAVDQSMRKQPITMDMEKLGGAGSRSDRGALLFTKGDLIINPRLKIGGKYRIHLNASATQAGDEPARMVVLHKSKTLADFKVAQHSGNEKTFTVEVELKKGFNDLRARFPNDFYDPKSPDPSRRDRNLMIHSISLEGPIGSNEGRSEIGQRILPARSKAQTDSSYARQVVRSFASRAFRRPATEDETTRYANLAIRLGKEQQSLTEGLLGAMQAVLVSPSFLYIGHTPAQKKPIQVDEFTLASRLSYFLWSSMPDDELLELAGKKQLRGKLNTQVTRMLADPRAQSFSRNFTGQWLQLRDLDIIRPDGKAFRQFTNKLRLAMKKETQMFIDHILLGDRSLMEFITADYSFLNVNLARYYKISGVSHKDFRKVKLTDTRRRGILTHGSILTLTSTPTRTSPVLRGKYVLENILDITPPPPPPNLPDLEDQKDHAKLTLRRQLEIHRKKSACAGCHNLMDPVGLAFENFDAIGRWRQYDKGRLIDSTGKLVTGEKVEHAAGLINIISTNKRDEFLRCVTRKMLTYALGRGVTRYDRLAVEKILSQLQKNNYTSHTLIRAIVHSRAFQMH